MSISRTHAENIYVKFILKTGRGDKLSFYELLNNYKNRPFDRKEDVLKKLSQEEQDEFKTIWEGHVNVLKKIIDELKLKFPIPDDRLSEILRTLESTLSELVKPLTNALSNQLIAEKSPIDFLDNYKRGYAFHLLTATNPVKAGKPLTHPEFNRLLRNAIFKENIEFLFCKAMEMDFKKGTSLNSTMLKKHKAINTSLAESAFLAGLNEQIASLEAFELYEVAKCISITSEKTSEQIKKKLIGIWEKTWIKLIDDNKNSYETLHHVLNLDVSIGNMKNIKETALFALLNLVKDRSSLHPDFMSTVEKFDKEFATPYFTFMKKSLLEPSKEELVDTKKPTQHGLKKFYKNTSNFFKSRLRRSSSLNNLKILDHSSESQSASNKSHSAPSLWGSSKK